MDKFTIVVWQRWKAGCQLQRIKCLCCLLTPGLSRGIQCHLWLLFFYAQIRHQDTSKVANQLGDCRWPLPSCVLRQVETANSHVSEFANHMSWTVRHLVQLRGLCGYVWVNILTLSPPRATVWWTMKNTWSPLEDLKSQYQTHITMNNKKKQKKHQLLVNHASIP